jgi:uncharacterized protein (DUF169 family)
MERTTMSDYASISKILTESLKLETPPVAVCVTDRAPQGVPESTQAAAAGCVFWERGAQSAFVTSPKDHGSCAVGMYTHHMPLAAAQQTDLNDSLKIFGDLGYVRSEDVAGIPVLKDETKYVTYAPLGATPVPPSTVLIFANSRQSLAITEAVQQLEPSAPPALGRPACAVIPQVINTGKSALSLGCCGARAYLNVMTDEFALWTLPGPRIAEYAEVIKRLAQANQVLTQFHKLRRKDVEAGRSPSVQESMVRLQEEIRGQTS